MEKKRYCMRRKTWRRATFPRWNLWPTDQPPSFRLSGAATEIYSRVKSSTTVREGGRECGGEGGRGCGWEGVRESRAARGRESASTWRRTEAREGTRRGYRARGRSFACFVILLFYFFLTWNERGRDGREFSPLILHLAPLPSEIQHSDLYIASYDLLFRILFTAHFWTRVERRVVQQYPGLQFSLQEWKTIEVWMRQTELDSHNRR